MLGVVLALLVVGMVALVVLKIVPRSAQVPSGSADGVPVETVAPPATADRALALLDGIVAANSKGDAAATCDLVTHRLALYLSGFTRTCEDTIDEWWSSGEPAFPLIDPRPGDVRIDARHPGIVVVRLPPERARKGPAAGNAFLLVEVDGELRVDAVLGGWEKPLPDLLARQRSDLELDADRQDVDPRRRGPEG